MSNRVVSVGIQLNHKPGAAVEGRMAGGVFLPVY